MHVYPLDFKDKKGKLFWTLPKRPPTEFHFDVEEKLCIDFITHYSGLLARVSGIKYKELPTKKQIVTYLKDFKVPEFKLKESDLKEIKKEVDKEEGKELTEEEKE